MTLHLDQLRPEAHRFLLFSASQQVEALLPSASEGGPNDPAYAQMQNVRASVESRSLGGASIQPCMIT